MNNIDKVLTRGVETILPSKEDLAKLMTRKKITLYLGIDPSNPQIHLGNACALRKLRQFQELGHHVILLIGDFTGMIGDPTDKTSTRKKLTRKQILENAKTYKEQAAKILNFDDPNPAEIKFNSQWLGKLSSQDWIELASLFTAQQLEERDMFIRRKKEGKPIYLHEFLYPVMQGYDSVAMNIDLEVGGTDQTFNMLVGRQLMKTFKNKEKFVLTVSLLTGTDGQKMGKTRGNFIAITEPPSEMFGKIMSLKDELIKQYFELATDINLKSIDFKKNPMELKKQLAFEIVKIYHSQEAAQKAQSQFEYITHQKGTTPASIPTVTIQPGTTIQDFLIGKGYTTSMSGAKEMITSGAIDINNVPVTDRKTILGNDQVVKIGKKKIVRVRTAK